MVDSSLGGVRIRSEAGGLRLIGSLADEGIDEMGLGCCCCIGFDGGVKSMAGWLSPSVWVFGSPVLSAGEGGGVGFTQIWSKFKRKVGQA